jgi:hypothetical protein
MSLAIKRFSSLSGASLVFLAALALGGAESRAQASPFAGLAGSWSGTGTIQLSNGTSERIRCRATYAVASAGDAMQQSLRCASDSYRFELGSDVVHRAGAITGTWSEATRNVGGSVAGRAAGNQIVARVDAPGFSADLTMVTKGTSQSVTIRSQSTELTGVNITLSKGR